MEALTVETTKTFDELAFSTKKISVFQGGARSGKTYNICLWLIYMASSVWEGKVISICRTTYPSLRATVMRDFFDILTKNNRYSEENYSKQEGAYWIRTNMFEFFSVDMPQKYRGRKRDILFMNEANEFDYDAWTQLSLRTSMKIILDFNPSMIEHFIYDKIMTRKDCDVYFSTYLDNPFLEESIVYEIELLRQTDKTLWTVYGLGERAQIGGLIYTNWQLIDEMPPDLKWLIAGLDFGYTNSPSACLDLGMGQGELFLDELLYQTRMTNPDIGNFFENTFPRNRRIVADSAEEKSITELKMMGWNVIGAKKGPNSVIFGIQLLQQYKLNITRRSINLMMELRRYKWREDKNGEYMNEPVSAYNHLLDAARYAATYMLSEDIYSSALFVPTRKNRW
jgi:phage terminase large subunit